MQQRDDALARTTTFRQITADEAYGQYVGHVVREPAAAAAAPLLLPPTLLLLAVRLAFQRQGKGMREAPA
jgi:hypothetical protein